MRDTALYYPLRNLVGVKNEGVWPSLRKLAAAVLNEDMHAVGTAHDPVRFFIFLFLFFLYLSLSDEVLPRSDMSGDTSD